MEIGGEVEVLILCRTKNEESGVFKRSHHCGLRFQRWVAFSANE